MIQGDRPRPHIPRLPRRRIRHVAVVLSTAVCLVCTACGLRASEQPAALNAGSNSGTPAANLAPQSGGVTSVAPTSPGIAAPGSTPAGTGTRPSTINGGSSSGAPTTSSGAGAAAPGSRKGNGHATNASCPNNSVNDAAQGVTANSLTIGGLLDQSSAAASQLAPYITGMRAGQLWVNQHGGICGRQLQIDIEDTQDNSGTYLADSRDLIDNKHVFSLVSGDLSANASYIDQKRVPVIGGESAGSIWFQSPMYFPIGNQFNGTAMLAYWPGTHHLIHKAAVMSVALAVSQQGCSTTVQELKALHIPVVYQASVPIGSTDLSSYVQQARAKGADGILQCFDITTSVVLMRALQQQNWHPYVASSSGAGDTQLLSAAPPKTLEGMQVNFPVPSFNDTTLPVIKNEYLPAYRAVAGPNAEQSDWGVRGFISVLLLQRAVQSAGPSRAAVINWLNHQKRLNLDGLLPPDQSYVPNKNGAHVEPKCSQVFTVHNAQFVSASHGWVCISAG